MDAVAASCCPVDRIDDGTSMADQTVEQRLALARSALDGLMDPCVVLAPTRDRSGRIIDFVYVDANRAACEYNGLSYSEQIGRTLLQMYPQHLENGLFDAYAKVVETHDPLARLDETFPAEQANGTFRYFDLRAMCAGGNLVLSWHDGTLRHEQAVAIAESERRYRILTGHSSDVVYETDLDGIIQWVSPSVEQVLGWTPAEVVGKPSAMFMDPARVEGVAAHRRAVAEGRASDAVLEVRALTAHGDLRWMEGKAEAVNGFDGAACGVVVGLRDIQRQVTSRRAVSTLTAGNAILVRAESEAELLVQMCNVAVEAGGYRLAWYGRPIDDDERSVVAVATSTLNGDYVDEIRVSWGDGPRGQGPTGRAIRLGVSSAVEDFLLDATYLPWRDTATSRGLRSSVSIPVRVDGRIDGAFMVYAAEPKAFDAVSVDVLENLAAQLGYGLGRIRDAAGLKVAVAEQRLLRTAIDQSSEAIVVTDTTPSIRYANPAALRSTGFSEEEVIGENPRIFQSGLHEEAFYEQMWSRLDGGQTWRGVLMNRRKNGEFYEEDANITPVHDATGRRIAYVAVKHDLTRERRLEAVVSRDQADRDTIIELLRDLRPSDSIGTAGAAICRAARRLDSIDGAMVLHIGHDGTVVTIAIDGQVPTGQEVGDAISVVNTDEFLAAIGEGAWWVDLSDPESLYLLDPAYYLALRDQGFTAAAYAPVRWGGELIGLLAAATRSSEAASRLPTRLGVLAELASFAGMVLGPQAEANGQREELRQELTDIIEHERFHTVFEPVVDLASGAPVGYEALTRFDDHTAPDRRFAIAHSVGLGSELEVACARMALAAAGTLPTDVWVGVNFSPSTLIDGSAVDVVRASPRPVVVEITEHSEIENYAAVRHAISRFGSVRVAVDDAGSGFASLRHILELQPDIIKLDIALVRDIDSDPARQALAAGLRHFAALTGTTIIAEGVETAAEAHTVRQLGVDLAQGYLFDTRRRV